MPINLEDRRLILSHRSERVQTKIRSPHEKTSPNRENDVGRAVIFHSRKITFYFNNTHHSTLLRLSTPSRQGFRATTLTALSERFLTSRQRQG